MRNARALALALALAKQVACGMWQGLSHTAGRSAEPLSIKYFNTQALLKFIHGRF